MTHSGVTGITKVGFDSEESYIFSFRLHVGTLHTPQPTSLNSFVSRSRSIHEIPVWLQSEYVILHHLVDY